jgi:hypothetical protein
MSYGTTAVSQPYRWSFGNTLCGQRGLADELVNVEGLALASLNSESKGQEIDKILSKTLEH